MSELLHRAVFDFARHRVTWEGAFVYVFRIDPGGWRELAKLPNPHTSERTDFGAVMGRKMRPSASTAAALVKEYEELTPAAEPVK